MSESLNAGMEYPEIQRRRRMLLVVYGAMCNSTNSLWTNPLRTAAVAECVRVETLIS
jgi:hypothetical protein